MGEELAPPSEPAPEPGAAPSSPAKQADPFDASPSAKQDSATTENATAPAKRDASPAAGKNQEPARLFDNTDQPPQPKALEEDPFKDDPLFGSGLGGERAPSKSQPDLSVASEEDCRRALERLKDQRLDAITLQISPGGRMGEDVPYECTLGDEPFMPREWAGLTYTWKASGLCHKPLYFEDEQLERYGHSWGPYVQPLVSGAHFFGTLPILPYKMGLKTPNECVYVLGHYRPGSCAPYMIDPIPFTWRAALFEGGVAYGVAAVIP